MTLNTSPFSYRVFGTVVLLTLGLGYLLAIVYLFTGHVKHFMDEGATAVEAVQFTYHGLPTEEPRLLVTLRGSMASTVSANEFATIQDWITAGASEASYPEKVGPIIDNNCVSCHGADGYYPPLTSFDDVVPLTNADSGMDVSKLARMTHVHLLGMPMLFYMLAALFIRTRFHEGLKAIIVVIPFVGIILDVLNWWLTKADANAAVGVIIGGAMMGIGFTLQWMMTFYDIWIPYRGTKSAAKDTM